MASNPVDPLHTLQAALKVSPNSKEQADLLAVLREQLENAPAPIPILAGTLTGLIVNAGDSLLKRWVIDLLHFAICRSSLSIDQRTQMAAQALDTLAQLVDDPNPAVVKVIVQTLTTVYPLLFRFLCTNRSNGAAWNTLAACKTRIIEFLWSPTSSVGVKVSAMKFVQRVILVQTRGVSDPRLQNKNDPNLSFCPPDHPFIPVAQLENEGKKLFDGLVATLYGSQHVDLLSALLNSWATLTKLRPGMVPMIVGHLKQWTPATLAGLPASSIKSVEKAIRILLVHISRVPANVQYVSLINEALAQQGVRMDKAALEEKKRKAAVIESRKRPLAVPTEPVDAKRLKLEPEAPSTAAAAAATSANLGFLASFDFTSLPATLITELIVANLEAFTEPTLLGLVQVFRESRGLGTAAPPAAPAVAPPTGPKRAAQLQGERDAERSLTPQTRQIKPIPTGPTASRSPPPQVVKDEPVDPLQMDIDQDELEYEPDRLNEELSRDIPIEAFVADIDSAAANLQLIDFKLPPPRELSDNERTQQLRTSVTRIWDGAKEINEDALPVESTQAGGHSAPEIWMLLLVRMITRVAEPPPTDDDAMDESGPVHDFYVRQDELRQNLCDYIMSDFPARVRLATTWMNEEWYNDQIRLAEYPNWRPNYDAWLNQIVADVLVLLRELCTDPSSPDKMQVGFATLRGLVINRPSMRVDALMVLLELTTHSEKKTRGAAINTVKLWVPNTQPMDGMVREFALQIQPARADSKIEEDTTIIVDGEEGPTTIVQAGASHNDGQLPPEDLVDTPYLPRHIDLPAKKSQVLQHVELLFALSVKVPEFLDEIFEAYGQMDVTELITALIRSLGSSHGKLLTLMRTCPPGAESLALRVLTIFTEHGRASTQLVALVKALINERDLDARFLIPIIAEMDKPDIMRHLPRIVSILNGQAEPKNLVRSVFSSVVTTPPQTFGSVTSNLPRVRQSELLTPAELMVLLHDSEKEIGLKSAIEAIGICFSMTDVFRSEILAVVMQQIMDEPVLPVLFLRTVIQAVTTYKSLVGFVSTTLLSRLITKKIWTNAPLWEGFIRCAKVIAPASFGALLQLPKDQLRELVDKQPSLKSGLRDFVTKKAPNKARVAGFLDIFGDPEESNPTTPVHVATPDDFTPPAEPTPEPALPHTLTDF
ncbi:Symplekin tight junction protein C terminal-domain-containing protein [Lyophyllum atratum]|nr:Symplekin tight junction protein C terminal-domain-containing protein [Lyophyllum atratum]